MTHYAIILPSPDTKENREQVRNAVTDWERYAFPNLRIPEHPGAQTLEEFGDLTHSLASFLDLHTPIKDAGLLIHFLHVEQCHCHAIMSANLPTPVPPSGHVLITDQPGQVYDRAE
jgi:hypothetical protein